MKEIEVGKVSDYFAHIGVVAITVSGEGIKVGDTLHFKGHTTDFTQKITSMQVEHEQVEEAGVGADVGIKVKDRVRSHDHVYKVVED
jgi:putative protease